MSRVLHLSEFTKGGVETHLNEILKYQSSNHEVYLMVSDHNTSWQSMQISPDKLILYPYQRKAKYYFKAMRSIQKKLKEINPDIVHVHGTFAGFFLRTLLFFNRQRPIVIYCAHGWAFLMEVSTWKRKLIAGVERLLTLQTDYLIHISSNEYRKAMGFGLSHKKSVIVYNGVSDAQTSEALPISVHPEKINLLFVGRFDRQKGFDLLLDVFNEHHFENVALYLAGESVLDEASHTYPSNAIKLGWVDNTEIDHYMRACDAVIVPSRWEGFGIVAIEALRNKKPVIASNRGALPEIIEHGTNGYLFDFDQKEELVQIIQSLSKDQLEVMGRAGERIFRKRFHSDHMNKQIERLYEDALNTEKDLYTQTISKYV